MTEHAIIPETGKPRVVIVGGGFAGLELAKKLCSAAVQVVLIDKQNFHTFQPLLYQVATAALEAESIVYPFRKMFDEQDNFYFRLAEVQSVDTLQQVVFTSIGLFRYDYLIIATGATTNFYGNDKIKEKAISIKTIEDALSLRNTILYNFEKALQTDDQEQLNSLMDYVIVGGGPTGVEIAGALSELKKHVFPKDYKELDFVNMDIHLVQSGQELLKGMSQKASAEALHSLEKYGVKVWLNSKVKYYDGRTVLLDTGERLHSHTLIWAAGVTGSLIDGLNKECVVSGNRIKVDEYNRVVGYENVFAVGDIAAMITPEHPHGHPMMAQPAMQQGKLLAKNLKNHLKGKKMSPFKYRDQGSMATIGRNRAVADLKVFGKELRYTGLIAWLIWMVIHLLSIIGFRNKTIVLLNWMFSYFSYDKGMRLIIGEKRENLSTESVAEKAVVN
ncbi:NAD(P)/FAD-dependent oxidoreductase [Chryseosolibacter indicus]|uniref:NADH:ubiquinone reductase (non-electrogenic) n=1 Tax=Chryseosolibacter indicus TaxID=2782351 RepID=A0ABS5VS41_9BACT|nr:NAD(P)/FAD-dependent oxidoreductase [Chryseosolibacter indicus]MBT1703679.1 NAD(P)/FAD-dependent oxidoreductase [Chryseosolibacter indicus]